MKDTIKTGTVPLDSEQLKEVQLRILDEVDAFCKEHGIRYWLCYGTLIGAARHQGFIPWDDDVDICMSRPDYEKFCRLFPKSGSRYSVRNLSMDKKFYALPFGKVSDPDSVLKEMEAASIAGMGVNIDIFPLDGLGNDQKKAEATIEKCRGLMQQMYLCGRKRSPKGGLRTRLRNGVLFAVQKLNLKMIPYRKMKRLGEENPYEDSKYVGVLVGTYGKGEVLERAWFEETVMMPFEKGEYPVPAGYDAVLRSIYGDYMQLPPKEKQVTHHSFRAYFKEERSEA